MGFTTPCFIRKSTKELTDKVYSFGGRKGVGFWHSEKNTLLVAGTDFFSCLDNERGNAESLLKDLVYDCKTNEAMFLALAALNDESDYMQWFTNGQEWIFCDREDWIDMYSVLCVGQGVNTKEHMSYLDTFHKATEEEVIKYFKGHKYEDK